MKRCGKILAVTSALILLAGFIGCRAGAFNSILHKEPEPPAAMSGSKSAFVAQQVLPSSKSLGPLGVGQSRNAAGATLLPGPKSAEIATQAGDGIGGGLPPQP